MTTKKEKLKFAFELWAEYWDKKPIVEIRINEDSKFRAEIDGTENSPTVIEFEHELVEGEKCDLQIVRSNKDNSQTFLEDGKIIKDQLLNIKSIEIDEIDIGALVYEGVYTPDYPEPWATDTRKAGTELAESMRNVTCMGHNGVWSLQFQSPFYMWLLENLY